MVLGEYNTWRLFEDMLAARYTPPAPGLGQLLKNHDDRFAADGDAFIDFISTDPTAREHRVVLSWLHEIADRDDLDLEQIETELDRASPRGQTLSSQGWLETRERLKSSKRQRTWDVDEGAPNVSSQNREGLVYHLDPDASSRLHKKIEYQDETFEAAFWQICWELFRRGAPMSHIEIRCDERNELIKAVTIGALRRSAIAPANAGARYRWRLACKSAALHGSSSDHERAVFGFVGGDSKSVEPVCESWEDYYLAQCNAQLLERLAPMLPRVVTYVAGKPRRTL